MAEQTIRDVVIRCKLKVVDSAAVKSATAQIKKSTDETEKQAQAVDKVKNKVKTAVQIEREKTQLLKEQLKVETAREKRVLDQLKFDKERLKIQQQMAKLNAPVDLAEVSVNGGVPGPAKPQNMQDPALEIGDTNVKVAKIFAATMVIEQIPEALKQAASGDMIDSFAKVGLGLVEGLEGVVVSLSDLVADAAMAATGTDIGRLKPTLSAGMRSRMERMGIDTGGTIEEEKRARLAAIIDRQATLEQQKIDLVKKLIPAENELLKITKEKIASARSEFGMLTAREQEGVVATARRAQRVGFGGLDSDEADQIRKRPAIAAMFAQQAAQQASTGASGQLFGQLVEMSGQGAILAWEQANQDQENRQAIMAINELHIMDALALNVDPNKVAETMTNKIAPLLKEAMQRAADKLRDELARAGRISEGARSYAGAAGRLK